MQIARAERRSGPSPLQGILGRARPKNLTMTFAILIVLGIFLLTLVGPMLTPYDPIEIGDGAWREPPSTLHPMGTDNYGRDIFSRLVHAARLDLTIGVVVAALSFLVGSLVGAFSGYIGGLFDDVVMRVADIVIAFPAFILAMGITAMLGTEVPFVVLAVAISYTPYIVRITRSEMLSVRELDYAAAAKCVGNPPWRIVLRHLLPNSISASLAQASLAVGWAILDVSGLSFLGLGIQPPRPEWGVMVRDGVSGIVAQDWWIYFFPGALITLTGLGFSLLGDGLRDLLAPRSR
jgi:peptide/nickel transport system permease protein